MNTSAAVKAVSDICCTSANARKVVESLGAPRVIMIPDEYLAKNVAAETKVEIIAWRGRCEVHEQFTAADIRELREAHPGTIVLAHPECAPEVVAVADFAGSTADMVGYVGTKQPGPCRARDRMLDERQRRRALSGHRVRAALRALPAYEAHHAQEYPPRPRNPEGEVTIDPAIAAPARRAVERMLAL